MSKLKYTSCSKVCRHLSLAPICSSSLKADLSTKSLYAIALSFPCLQLRELILFQYDCAPVHKSHSVMTWFVEVGV